MLIHKILRAVKALVIGLIPGMFFRRFSKIKHDLNISGHPDKARRTAIGLVITILALIGGFVLGGYLYLAILTPVLGPVSQGVAIIANILSIFIPGLILMEFGFLLTKQFFRLVSWLKYNSDPHVINPTNREKYQEKHSNRDSIPPDDFKMQKTCAQTAMRTLYAEKLKIKNNPEGYFGELSIEQKSKCKAINYAVSKLRDYSVNTLFKPRSSLTSQARTDALRRKLGDSQSKIDSDNMAEDKDYFKYNGITEDEITFLKKLLGSK